MKPPQPDRVAELGAPQTRARDEFEQFYAEQHAEQVRRAYLLVRSNELANDIVHDAMVGVWRRWGDLANPAGYVNRSVLNGCRDAGRRRATRAAALHRLVEPVRSPEREVLDDVLTRLPFNQRAAVVLRYYSGCSIEEIATALDCSPNSIGPWITRALNTMRKELS